MNARVMSGIVAALFAVPVDPASVPRWIAANRVDSDANPGYTSDCRFLGVARPATDVYSCTAGYPNDVTLRLEHDRDTPIYRATVLTDRLNDLANLQVDLTEWCTMLSDLPCSDSLDRRVFPRIYGTLVPGNIGCHWIDFRVHRLDPPCSSRLAQGLTGPSRPWPQM